MTAGDERMAAPARSTGGGGSPVAGGEGEWAAELPHTTAHLKATAASGCDGGRLGTTRSPALGTTATRTEGTNA